MHRVRYFKVNGRILWDRTNKLDLLTGVEWSSETRKGRNEQIFFAMIFTRAQKNSSLFN